MASKPIMQFYAKLKGAHIPIWRRFQTPDNLRFSQIAYLLLTMFEMEAGHLFSIEINDGKTASNRTRMEICTDYMDDFDMTERSVRNAAEESVRQYIDMEGKAFTLEYDFGDGWEIKVVLEKIFEDVSLPRKALPRVLEGAGYGIIEDCGGVEGLQRLDEAFRKGKGAEYRMYADWLGVEELDLQAFDIEDINSQLKKAPRIYKEFYE